MDEESANVRIVGIGASAGGIEALTEFFGEIPDDTGMAFVVIQHLDPNQPSQMASLLARFTAMTVIESADGMEVEANHVYTMPPASLFLPRTKVIVRLRLCCPETAPTARRA